MKTFICPSCEIEQTDVLVQTGSLLYTPDDGWYEYRCLGCGAILIASFLEEKGMLPG